MARRGRAWKKTVGWGMMLSLVGGMLGGGVGQAALHRPLDQAAPDDLRLVREHFIYPVKEQATSDGNDMKEMIKNRWDQGQDALRLSILCDREEGCTESDLWLSLKYSDAAVGSEGVQDYYHWWINAYTLPDAERARYRSYRDFFRENVKAVVTPGPTLNDPMRVTTDFFRRDYTEGSPATCDWTRTCPIYYTQYADEVAALRVRKERDRVIPKGQLVAALVLKRNSPLYRKLRDGITDVYTGFRMEQFLSATKGVSTSQTTDDSRTHHEENTRTSSSTVGLSLTTNAGLLESFWPLLSATGSYSRTDSESQTVSNSNTDRSSQTVAVQGVGDVAYDETANYAEYRFPGIEKDAAWFRTGVSLEPLEKVLNSPVVYDTGHSYRAWSMEHEPQKMFKVAYDLKIHRVRVGGYVQKRSNSDLDEEIKSYREESKPFTRGWATIAAPWETLQDGDDQDVLMNNVYQFQIANPDQNAATQYLAEPPLKGTDAAPTRWVVAQLKAGQFTLHAARQNSEYQGPIAHDADFYLRYWGKEAGDNRFLACRAKPGRGNGFDLVWSSNEAERAVLNFKKNETDDSYQLTAKCSRPTGYHRLEQMEVSLPGPGGPNGAAAVRLYKVAGPRRSAAEDKVNWKDLLAEPPVAQQCTETSC